MSTARRLPAPPGDRDPAHGRPILILCFGFEAANLRRQPWYTVDGIARGLAAHGRRVVLVTDAAAPPASDAYEIRSTAGDRLGLARSRAALPAIVRAVGAERVLAVGGIGELARLPRLRIGVPVHYLLASPRLTPREVLDLPPAAWTAEWRLALRPLLNALLPASTLLAAARRAGIAGLVYLGPETRDRLVAAGLPDGPVIAPCVDPVTVPRRGHEGPPRLGYFGPALRLRGLDLVLDTFESLRRGGTRLRLRLVLRDDRDRPPAWLARRLRTCPWRDEVELLQGQLTPSELAAALAEVDLFLLPFRAPVSESPLVVAEAALSGRPVVVLDRPGVGRCARRLGGIAVDRPEQLPRAVLEALDRRAAVARADWSDWRAATVALLPERLDAVDGLRRLRLVGLCGPDGVGKTTLARALVGRLARRSVPARYVWSRYRNYLSKPLLGAMRALGLSRTVERNGIVVRERRFRAVPGLARLFVLLQALDQALELLFRLRRRGTVVADRCLYDTLVDLAVETGLEDFVLDRLAPLLERLLPTPRAVLLLEREDAAVSRDRPDAALDPERAERLRLYGRLAGRHGLLRLRVTEDVADTLAAAEALLRSAARHEATGERP